MVVRVEPRTVRGRQSVTVVDLCHGGGVVSDIAIGRRFSWPPLPHP